jgi:hypothetical protein
MTKERKECDLCGRITWDLLDVPHGPDQEASFCRLCRHPDVSKYHWGEAPMPMEWPEWKAILTTIGIAMDEIIFRFDIITKGRAEILYAALERLLERHKHDCSPQAIEARRVVNRYKQAMEEE